MRTAIFSAGLIVGAWLCIAAISFHDSCTASELNGGIFCAIYWSI